MVNHWNRLTSNEIKNILKRDPVVLLMVGSCEQHGDHLPVGTDLFISENIVEKAAKISKAETIILPPISYGYSPHHMNFYGTISIKQTILKELIKSICFSLIKFKVDKILILNGHGGNQPLLECVINEIGEKKDLNLILIRYWDLISSQIKEIRDSKKGGMGHAGEFETSLMEFIMPNLIKFDKREDETKEGISIYSPDMFAKNDIFIYKTFDKFSKKGIIGNSTISSSEKGRKLFELITHELSNIIDYVDEHGLNFQN